MEALFDHVMLSRVQFASILMFHILWPVLTIGLSLFLMAMEALWLKTGVEDYYHHARFWSRLFLLNFGVGVVTGVPLELQFGTNWAPFSTATGDFFGNILGFEGALSFMLEAAFLGIMIFGWKRVPPGMHLFATGMVAFGASLSAFWIMVANSWMQTPAGGHVENGGFVVDSYWEAIFNPNAPWGVSHMWVACLEISLFVVGGISAWYLLKDRHTEFFLKSFKFALLSAIIVAPLQIVLGDSSGASVIEHQPAKNAAIEAHWETNPPGQGAAWAVLAWPNEEEQVNDWALTMPNMLSLLDTHSLTGQVQGLREFPHKDQPPVLLPFYAFRIMVAIGFLLFFLMLWTVWAWHKGRLRPECVKNQKWLLRAWVAAIPLSYLAMEMGWVTREVGRQPWVVYGWLRTEAGASTLPAIAVASSLVTYAVVYTLLFVLFLVFATRIIRKGPDLRAPAPARDRERSIRTKPGKELHDKRAVEEH